MTRRRESFLLCGIALLVALAACDSTASTSSGTTTSSGGSPSAGPAGAQACVLFTQQEAEGVLGSPTHRKEGTTLTTVQGHRISDCILETDAKDSIEVLASFDFARADFDKERQTYPSLPSQHFMDETGIGDAAYLRRLDIGGGDIDHGGYLTLIKGSTEVAITVIRDATRPSIPTSAIEQIGKTVAGRL